MNVFNLSFGKDSMATKKQISIDEYIAELVEKENKKTEELKNV